MEKIHPQTGKSSTGDKKLKKEKFSSDDWGLGGGRDRQSPLGEEVKGWHACNNQIYDGIKCSRGKKSVGVNISSYGVKTHELQRGWRVAGFLF